MTADAGFLLLRGIEQRFGIAARFFLRLKWAVSRCPAIDEPAHTMLP